MSAPGMCGGGGELNLIPIGKLNPRARYFLKLQFLISPTEQLIHIEDVVHH